MCKLILSRLPFGYGLWQRLGIFRHGTMDAPGYALEVFRNHYGRVEFARKGKEFVALELGPGDAAVSGMIAAAHGSGRCYLVDTGDYATRNIAVYRAMAERLRTEGLEADRGDVTNFDQMLTRCHSTYLTQGLTSLREIPSASVDFIWSQAVLEHIRVDEFGEVNRELRRVLRPDGVCSHRIDLSDHLGGALNNLRFSRTIWESKWFSRAGFYTNRIRYREMLSMFQNAGFELRILATHRWPALPTPAEVFSDEFRNLPRDDLLIYAFDVILTAIN